MTTNKIDKKPPYLMIAILFFGAFISFLNNSLLNVALPTIMVDFEKTMQPCNGWQLDTCW